jgi:hypothetical protein
MLMAHERREGENHAVANPLAEMFQRQKEEIARLTSELEAVKGERDTALALNRKVVCSYCGDVREYSDRETMISSLAEHLESGDCPKHPLLQAAEWAEAKDAEMEAARLYLARLLHYNWPDLSILDTLDGVCTQIDNAYAVGYKQQTAEIQRLTEENGRLKGIYERAMERVNAHQVANDLTDDSLRCSMDAHGELQKKHAQLEADLERANNRLNPPGVTAKRLLEILKEKG